MTQDSKEKWNRNGCTHPSALCRDRKQASFDGSRRVSVAQARVRPCPALLNMYSVQITRKEKPFPRLPSEPLSLGEIVWWVARQVPNHTP